AALAEGLGEDLGHAAPGYAVKPSDGAGRNGPRVYPRPVGPPPSLVRPSPGRWSRAARDEGQERPRTTIADGRADRDDLLDSGVHGSPCRRRAVPRAAVRGPVR